MCLHRCSMLEMFHDDLGQTDLLSIQDLVDEEIILDGHLLLSFFPWHNVADCVHEHHFGDDVHVVVGYDGGNWPSWLAKNSGDEFLLIVHERPLVLYIVREPNGGDS